MRARVIHLPLKRQTHLKQTKPRPKIVIPPTIIPAQTPVHLQITVQAQIILQSRITIARTGITLLQVILLQVITLNNECLKTLQIK